MRSKNGEVEKFVSAKGGKKITDATNEEIAQALRYVMMKIGIRANNLPVNEEKQLLIFHVFENFPENTLDEIRLAFDWGIAGRLCVEMNCYENFTCAYFSSVMKAYNFLACRVRPEITNG